MIRLLPLHASATIYLQPSTLPDTNVLQTSHPAVRAESSSGFLSRFLRFLMRAFRLLSKFPRFFTSANNGALDAKQLANEPERLACALRVRIERFEKVAPQMRVTGDLDD